MSKDASGTSSYERAFRYYYDALNRDTAAIYAERTTASTSPFATTNGWNENRITYDQNGNILTLFRDSTSQGSGGHTPIDNLAYTYDTNNPDQLQKVTDGTGAQYTNSGFRNRTGSTSSYTYDGNGNLTNEQYKGFSSIAYDVLNKTDKITFTVSANRYIDYTYNASGQLIRKRQYDNVGGVATLQNTTDYIDGFVYTTVSSVQTLQYFAMPEGRVLNTSGTLSQEYSIADQQGNVRITFDNTGTGGTAKVRQENSYYAFGLIMPGSTVTTPANPNKHLYNGGSEWQNDFSNLPDYYQSFNRNYDAALGRWIGVDPAAESAESMTSYQYAGNNPVMYNDPLGDLLEPPGAHIAPYTPWMPLNYGGPPDDIQQNQSDFFAAGGYGGGGNTIFNGYAFEGAIDVYNAGDGTADDPSTGSLATAVALINSVSIASGGTTIEANRFDNYIDDNGNVLHQSAYESANGGTYDYRASTSTLGGQTIITASGEIDGANDNINGQENGTSLFGTTVTNEFEAPNSYSNLLWSYSNYRGTVNDQNKGTFNLNLTHKNGKISADLSINKGKFSYSIGLDGKALSIGGYSINSGVSLNNGITLGGSYTDSKNNIQGFQINLNPNKIVVAAGFIVVETAPYWAPALAPFGL